MARILVIDDEDAVRATLRRMLERDQHEVTEAPHGAVGLRLFRQAPTDLVITNIYMPEKEGYETITELHRDFPDVGIIAVSGGDARGRTGTLRLARGLGAKHTLPKPVDWHQLKAAVDDVLNATK